ncbi:L-glutamate gamma-semialdehyde dehydrogenase [Caldinitratiruptor microaerophilus]|uniref:L-glutamate gamma-semialdehyde dehydrogenase n=1 Tax=Caldinitratiruptor microaerophilus TaxID=671077 RepID=A0AA35G696_9FIRM|nr:L-glutamate gamma-semialdehyde dehydrogenase [Caldinitratiruptor microaerophilus]BDG60931.1 1-pyrroline-5-carboxylate dehydrogenase [Caldinitratiruptor microaerophilus]
MAVAEFRNEPATDFGREENRRAYEAAIRKVESQFGRDYPLIIGGERVTTAEKIVSRNPAAPSEVVGTTGKAGPAEVDRALEAARKAFETWSRTDPLARARILWKAAAIMRRRKHELSATMTVEVGKTWPEADADTAEAIDFLEFYGREMARLAQAQPLTRLMGEDNEVYYLPLGVGVIHSPFNFPLAILTGMTSAAIVAGNTVLVKPSVHTPVIAAKFFEILEEAGLPPGVANYVPGDPAEIGEMLTTDPRIHFVSFTGSAAVGAKIHEQAARVQPGQRFLRRVVAEMGGKDAIIVDSEVDVDEAVLGIVTSAFGFGGQKCSACSRAIVLEDRYDEVLEKVTKAAQALRLGDPRRPEVQMGPVGSEAAYRRVLEYIQIGRGEGRLVTGGGAPEGLGDGYFVSPTIFADVDPHARIAQEEIFGPVLAFFKAGSFEEAVAIANDTQYGLTGSVYSRNRANLEYARREFHVGNLYFNRKCTGALVGVHPFGGFKMSGTDSKAGGRDYLLLFTQAKSVSEKF